MLFLVTTASDGLLLAASKDYLLSRQRMVWPPRDSRIVCPIVRGTHVSSVSGETEGNTGDSKKLKLKGIQELATVEIDPTVLKGKIVSGALLHLRSASPARPACENRRIFACR